jgi:hypothetical protein
MILLLTKNWNKSFLLITIFTLLFYPYGHFYAIIRDLTIFNFQIRRHRYLGFLWIILFIIAFWYISKIEINFPFLYQVLMIMVIVALSILLYQIIAFKIRYQNNSTNAINDKYTLPKTLSGTTSQPDVYYIILDGYSREDYLNEVLSYDNRPFLNELEGYGFYIANCSQANYSLTRYSLASSLNMEYVQSFYDISSAPNDRAVVEDISKYI